jgi:hypothetical protein
VDWAFVEISWGLPHEIDWAFVEIKRGLPREVDWAFGEIKGDCLVRWIGLLVR